MKTQILIVEPRDDQFEQITNTFQKPQNHIHRAIDGQQAISFIQNNTIDIAVIHRDLPDIDGLEILKILQKTEPSIPIIISSSQKGIDPMTSSLRLGAVDHISEPFDPKVLQIALRRATKSRILALTEDAGDISKHLLQGASPCMVEVREQIQYFASFKTTVLITGESGTGKELAAKTLHDIGQRAVHPFITVNCAAIPRELTESHLFGHIKGAFTSATTTRQGVFEAAHRGTLFLDEIGDLGLDVQAKWLRVLESQQIMRVGSTDPIDIDVRIIAATNNDLKKAVANGSFREDLYYRLNILRIDMPPLRLHPEDIPAMATRFLKNFAQDNDLAPKELVLETIPYLMTYPWPGNVRELKNTLERLAVMVRSDTILPTDLPSDIYTPQREVSNAANIDLSILEGLPLHTIEKLIIDYTLNRVNGNRTHAAKRLGISLRTLQRKLKEYCSN